MINEARMKPRIINKVQKSGSPMEQEVDLRPSLTGAILEEKPVKQSVDAHLKRLYDSQVLCDLNLVLGEGKRCVQFPIHRVALTSRSDKYLAALSDPASAGLREIRLPASVTSEEAVKQVISYLYTGQLRNVKEENVEDIFVVSDHLDLNTLKANCVDFLSRFDDGNIFKYLKICRRLNLSALLDRILKYLTDNIKILHKNSNIGQLTLDEFHSILGSKSVSEVRRLQIAVDWLTSTADYQWASTLLECVDFTLLSPLDIERELMPLESHIETHKDCVALLRNVYKDKALRTDIGTASTCAPSSPSHSPPPPPDDHLQQLVVIGGASDATALPSEVGDHVFIGTEKPFGGPLSWRKAEHKAPPRRGHQAVLVGDFVYVIGGYAPSLHSSIMHRPTNAVHRFHPRLQLWLPMSPMRVSRARFGVAHVTSDAGGEIYVFGGESTDGDDVIIITDTCEKYSIADNTWSHVRPLSLARSGVRACYHSDRIFVVGGQIEGKALPLVECYHPQNHSWSSRMFLAEGLTDGCLISANEDQLFYIGGAHSCGSTDGLRHEMMSSSAIRQYNEASDCWQTVARLPRPLHHLNAALLGSKVYVVGGMCSEDASYNGDVIVFDYDQYTVDTSPFPLPIAFNSVSAFQ